MRKNIFFILILLILNIKVFSDQTNDKNNFRSKSKYFMKFRGTVNIGYAHYFGRHKGISNGNHIQNIDYTTIDYTDSGDPSNTHHTAGEQGRIIGSSSGQQELGIYADYNLIAPFLTSDHFLFKDNNFKMSFYGELSPVSMSGGMGFTFTPIAFLQFQTGFKIGSGWSFAGLFNGLGRIDSDGTILVEPFYGPKLSVWFSTILQFDVAAIMDKSLKRWTHIVMVAAPKIMYEALLNVDDSQPFFWESSGRDNILSNGWNFMGSFFVGYQIPIIEDYTGEDRQFIKLNHKRFTITVAMLLKVERLRLTHFFDSPMSNGWGSDFCQLEFGPFINFDLPYNFYTTLLFGFMNDKEYTEDTVGNLDFRERKYEDWHVCFRRIAIVVGWNF